MNQNRQNTGKRRYTLNLEFTIIFFLLTAGTIVTILLANAFFLERYYVSDKQGALSQAYIRLDAAAKSDTITSDEFDKELAAISSNENISIIVMNSESQAVKYYAQDLHTMMERMWDNLLENTIQIPQGFDKEDEEAWERNGRQYFIVRKLKDKNDQRSQVVLDRKTNTQYIEMWGQLSDGSFYLMRTALESIARNTSIASRFVGIVGILAIVAGLLIAMLLAKRITRPIRQMTEISKRMRDLDFSAKYVGNDRTEIADLGENMNQLSKTLEKTIADLKTSNNELQKDIENREKIEQMQREFISSVTHELKTPIALIQGYAEGLVDGIADDPESRDFYCQTIMEESGKMNKMVQKLLTLTHLEFGDDDASFERFDIVNLIRSHIESQKVLMDNEGITVKMEQKDPIYVWADSFMVEEVFTNYLSNARNHCEPVPTKEGGSEKVIDIHFEARENCVRIRVFNTGKPIPEEALPRIWDKFYKVDKARTRAYGGSGVGLSIVKAIMDRMHQAYGADNYDNGVAFYFDLDTSAQGDGNPTV